ncbi:hypothetical protein [Streptacidiphilus anmyonensis]|uniref:hypothetical protein n=1 Tax=Streptacidiphilus anmyonensis TaxID=405782 RepID=UPI0005A72D9A|nr:hypothetical protein [Streptacidiphilus anmyonensis]
MTYAVTVDTSQPEGAPDLDELQRAGAAHLLREGLDAIEAIEGEDGEVVEIIDHLVGVHPGGALLKVFVEAPSLEDAEGAVESVVGEVLERTELLAAWTIDKCEVELHLDSAAESLAAADGPEAPAADPSTRAVAHPTARSLEENTPGRGGQEREEMRAKLRALAPLLAGVSASTLGHLTAEDLEDGKEVDEDFNVSAEDVALAAGAMYFSIDILIDEIFQDLDTLGDSPSAAQCDGGLMQLEGLPGQFMHLYTPLFARKLLVTAASLTGRMSGPGFGQLSCVAEELLLRLWLETTEATLDLYGLLTPGTAEALGSLRENVYEDLDHEWLYGPAMDGIDQDPTAAHLGIAPMAVKDWFTPFNQSRSVHPYATDGE